MASGKLEVSLSLTDKRTSKSQLGSILLLACWSLKVLLGQTVKVFSVQKDQTSCQRAFADDCLDESACNVMAFSDHTRWSCVDTLREYGEHYLLDK